MTVSIPKYKNKENKNPPLQNNFIINSIFDGISFGFGSAFGTRIFSYFVDSPKEKNNCDEILEKFKTCKEKNKYENFCKDILEDYNLCIEK